MTIVFTVARPFAIVTACDSAVREDIGGGDRSYSTGGKSWVLEGTGVVSTWGARDGNTIAQYIEKIRESGRPVRIDQLALDVLHWLQSEYDPRSRGCQDVGYHISGFIDGKPRIFHAFWNTPTEGRPEGLYELQDHKPESGMFMLYNGREALAGAVVQALLDEIRKDQTPPLDLGRGTGLVALAHLVLRVARELTLDVGPPFIARVINKSNAVYSATLPEWRSFVDDEFTSMRALATVADQLRE